jgi:hypothetical protein
VLVIRPTSLKFLVESKLKMDMSDLKKYFLEFVAYLENMVIIHDEHFYVVENKKTGDSGMKITGKISDAGSHSSGHNSGGISYEGSRNKASDCDRTKSGHGRSSDSTGTRKQWAREPPLVSAQKCVRARSITSPTVLTLERTKLMSCCQSTRRREMPTRRRKTSKL